MSIYQHEIIWFLSLLFSNSQVVPDALPYLFVTTESPCMPHYKDVQEQ